MWPRAVWKGEMECSQPAPPKPRVANALRLTLALASPPSVEARDMRMGKVWHGPPHTDCHSSKTLQDETSHHPARASFHTDSYITMLACMQHHTRCSCSAIITTIPSSRHQQTCLNKAYIHGRQPLFSPVPTLPGLIDKQRQITFLPCCP